jgi:SNF family Na+-dependent transporter
MPYYYEYTSNPVEMVGHNTSQLAEALTRMEDSIDYGRKAKLQLITSQMPTKADLSSFYTNLAAIGFHTSMPVAKVVDGIPCTELVIRKGSPAWAMLIPLIPTVIIGGLVAFGLVKIESITKAIMPLVLVTLGGLIILAGVVTRPSVVRAVGETAGRRYLPATIPVLPKKAPAASY